VISSSILRLAGLVIAVRSILDVSCSYKSVSAWVCNLSQAKAHAHFVDWFAGRKWKNKIKGVPNCLNYYEIFIVYIYAVNKCG
jgi:hypothetical protein